MASEFLKTPRPMNVRGEPVDAGSVIEVDKRESSEVGALLSVGCEKVDGPAKLLPYPPTPAKKKAGRKAAAESEE